MEQIEKRLDLYKIHRDIIKLQDHELDTCYNELSKLDELVKHYRHDKEQLTKQLKRINKKTHEILGYMENAVEIDTSYVHSNLEEIVRQTDNPIPDDY